MMVSGECDIALVNPVGLTAEMSGGEVMARGNPSFAVPVCFDVDVFLCDLHNQTVNHSLGASGANTAPVVGNDRHFTINGWFCVEHGDLQLSARWHCNAHSMGITLASHMGWFI
jgi:hypothetical protein